MVFHHVNINNINQLNLKVILKVIKHQYLLKYFNLINIMINVNIFHIINLLTYILVFIELYNLIFKEYFSL